MRQAIKRTLLAVLGAVVVAGAVAGCAHHGWDGGWNATSAEDSARFKARMVEKVGDKLALDAAQKARLGVLADKLREQKLALVGDAPDRRTEFQALIAGSSFDRGRAQALVEAKTAAIAGKSPEVIAAAADFFDSLNPTQQQQVRDFMNRRRGHGGPG